MRIKTLYLAGPQLQRPGEALAEAMRLLCDAAGFEALTLDVAALVERTHSEAMAREIYAERLARMRAADAGIIDLSPSRGPHCDPAAAFEAGFMAALGKPVFAYLNVGEEDDADLVSRVDAHVGIEMDEGGVLRDDVGAAVEDYGLPESLMLWAEARRLYVIVTPDVHTDLTGLELCLEAVKLYAG